MLAIPCLTMQTKQKKIVTKDTDFPKIIWLYLHENKEKLFKVFLKNDIVNAYIEIMPSHLKTRMTC